ncbi:hypothetical protein [Streptomyces sp. NPDC048172]|uniref:hypothetical protein n=1 Tax=Streptomyces sp. NPDC048172 TaxID=3365505 RepID=UPI0037131DA5
MRDLSSESPDLLVWAVSWSCATICLWLCARVFREPLGWYGSAVLGGVLVVVFEIAERQKERRRRRGGGVA